MLLWQTDIGDEKMPKSNLSPRERGARFRRKSSRIDANRCPNRVLVAEKALSAQDFA